MASYTIELRKIIDYYGREEVENWFKDYELSNFLTPTQIEQIEKFNVWSKDRLARKIVDNYYMREIGFETPALFKHFAKIEMEKIMERQLPKIYSNFLEYDPLSNVDFTETYTREIEGTNESEGISNSNSDTFFNSSHKFIFCNFACTTFSISFSKSTPILFLKDNLKIIDNMPKLVFNFEN